MNRKKERECAQLISQLNDKDKIITQLHKEIKEMRLDNSVCFTHNYLASTVR